MATQEIEGLVQISCYLLIWVKFLLIYTVCRGLGVFYIKQATEFRQLVSELGHTEIVKDHTSQLCQALR